MNGEGLAKSVREARYHEASINTLIAEGHEPKIVASILNLHPYGVEIVARYHGYIIKGSTRGVEMANYSGAGMTRKEIAEIMGVTRQRVHEVIKGSGKHKCRQCGKLFDTSTALHGVNPSKSYCSKECLARKSHRGRLSNGKCDQLLQDRRAGYKLQALSKKYGLSLSSVSRLCTRLGV